MFFLDKLIIGLFTKPIIISAEFAFKFLLGCLFITYAWTGSKQKKVIRK